MKNYLVKKSYFALTTSLQTNPSNMPAFAFALRDMNILCTQSTKQDLKPSLRSVSAPGSPQTPTLKDECPMERTATALPHFPSVSVSDELKDMWILKRATPIFDENDEEESRLFGITSQGLKNNLL